MDKELRRAFDAVWRAANDDGEVYAPVVAIRGVCNGQSAKAIWKELKRITDDLPVVIPMPPKPPKPVVLTADGMALYEYLLAIADDDGLVPYFGPDEHDDVVDGTGIADRRGISRAITNLQRLGLLVRDERCPCCNGTRRRVVQPGEVDAPSGAA